MRMMRRGEGYGDKKWIWRIDETTEQDTSCRLLQPWDRWRWARLRNGRIEWGWTGRAWGWRRLEELATKTRWKDYADNAGVEMIKDEKKHEEDLNWGEDDIQEHEEWLGKVRGQVTLATIQLLQPRDRWRWAWLRRRNLIEKWENWMRMNRSCMRMEKIGGACNKDTMKRLCGQCRCGDD